MSFIKKHLWKIFNLVLLFVTLTIYVWSKWYWSSDCAGNICSSTYMSSTLAPLLQAGLWLSVILAPFVILPQDYFRTFFTRIFWWYVPIVYIAVITIDPINRSFLSLGRELTTKYWLMGLGVLAAVSVTWCWWRSRKG